MRPCRGPRPAPVPRRLVRRGARRHHVHREATHTASSATSSPCSIASSAANSSALSSGKLSPHACCIRAAPRRQAIPASPGPCLPAGLAPSGARPAAGHCPVVARCKQDGLHHAMHQRGQRHLRMPGDFDLQRRRCGGAQRCASRSDMARGLGLLSVPSSPSSSFAASPSPKPCRSFPACAAPWPSASRSSPR